MEDVVVLMGPEGVGKSTVCRSVNYHLGLPLITLDQDRIKKLKSFGYSRLKALYCYITGGFWKAYTYTKPYEFLMVEEVLKNTKNGVIDLGAGSIIFHDKKQSERIKELLLKIKYRFLLLPSPDKKLSLIYLNLENTHLSKLTPNMNEYFLNFPYKDLANFTFYTLESSIDIITRDIEEIIIKKI